MGLTLKNLEDMLGKIGINDYDTSNSYVDSTGDFIEFLDPELNFPMVMKKILGNPILNKKIVNKGIDHVEIYSDVWVDGNRAQVAYLFRVGLGGSGTNIKMVTKYVQAPVNGSLKQFLSFEAYQNFVDVSKIPES